MAAGFAAMQQHSSCCSTSAAACTSVRFALVLDTVIAAVSIFIVLLWCILLSAW